MHSKISLLDKHTIQFDVYLHQEGVSFIHKRGKKISQVLMIFLQRLDQAS